MPQPRLNRKRRRSILTETQIVQWAKAHFRQHGRYPSALAGPVVARPSETWGRIDDALRQGRRGLRGGESLPVFLCRSVGKTRRMYKPVLSRRDIISWARAHFARSGRWPNVKTGPVTEKRDERWAWIDVALRLGHRGLPGGSSLSHLLDEVVGHSHKLVKKPMTIGQILKWAKEHRARTGRWPIPSSGHIPGTRESWHAVQTALNLGQRGLPGGDTLPRVLHRYFGRPMGKQPVRLPESQILEWADAFHRKHGRWPQAESGPVTGMGKLNWMNIDSYLWRPARGRAGGQSLARLLRKHRGASAKTGCSNLSADRVLGWADSFKRRVGRWPTVSSPMDGQVPWSWATMNKALLEGRVRGVRAGMALADVLSNRRGVHFHRSPGATKRTLKLGDVLLWAKAHARRTGQWPEKYDGRVIDTKGETWFGIDEALRLGARGLPKAKSLGLLFSGLPRPRALALSRRERTMA